MSDFFSGSSLRLLGATVGGIAIGVAFSKYFQSETSNLDTLKTNTNPKCSQQQTQPITDTSDEKKAITKKQKGGKQRQNAEAIVAETGLGYVEAELYWRKQNAARGKEWQKKQQEKKEQQQRQQDNTSNPTTEGKAPLKASQPSQVTTRLLVAENESEYRRTIPVIVKPGDTVLEIGCHIGITTCLLARQAGDEGFTVGIDSSEYSIGQAKERLRNKMTPGLNETSPLKYYVGDGLDIRNVLAIAKEAGKEWLKYQNDSKTPSIVLSPSSSGIGGNQDSGMTPSTLQLEDTITSTNNGNDVPPVSSGNEEKKTVAKSQKEKDNENGKEQGNGEGKEKEKEKEKERPLQFSVVYLDVSGSRDVVTLIECCQSITLALRPQWIVIKGQNLARMLYRTQVVEVSKVCDSVNIPKG